MVDLYIEMVKDPSTPVCRVVRKTAIVTACAVSLLVYYRHFVLQLSFDGNVLVTFGLSLVVIFIVGFLGGILVGIVYEWFLNYVDMQKRKSTVVAFLTEWIFAATAPLLGYLFFVLLSHFGD
ncbi:MAG: hypothetical protein PHI97_29400 [Desulfobulbus sp.]|nr:hypothetical protein [Desulfobulbus sp.]